MCQIKDPAALPLAGVWSSHKARARGAVAELRHFRRAIAVARPVATAQALCWLASSEPSVASAPTSLATCGMSAIYRRRASRCCSPRTVWTSFIAYGLMAFS